MDNVIPFKKPAQIETVSTDDGDVIIKAFRLLSYRPTQQEVVHAAGLLSICKDQDADYRAHWLARRIREMLGV